MFNNAVWKSLLKFVVLLVIFNLVSCGGNTSALPPSPVTVSYTITAAGGSNGSVTPSGVTTVAQGASQSYTITPASGFAVATLVVDGTTVAKSTTHTFTNVQANHTISATFSAAQAGNIALSLVPARTSGVAPLAVFFDASGTTDVAITARPFHDLEYTWDFGDPGAGTWTYGAQPGVNSKNSATGPVAAHVFEQPGTYSVSVTAFDGTNTVTTSKSITVTDPNTVFANSATACVSTSGTFTGCPTGATQVTTSSLMTAIGSISSTVKRILFRAGETWTTSARVQISQAGPGYIGSFGAGAKPIISYGSGSNYSILAFNSDDWRVVGLAIAGGGLVNGVNAFQNDARTQITLLRDDVTASNGSFDTSSRNTSSSDPITDQFTVQDCTSIGINGTSGTVNSWVYGTRFAFQGNFLDNQGTAISGGEHVMRFPKVTKGVISNNTPRNPGPNGKHLFTIRSANPIASSSTWDGTYSEQVVVSDNDFTASSITSYNVAIEPTNTVVDERLRDIIIERNFFIGQPSGQLYLRATVGTTVRNNIFDISLGSYPDAIVVAGDVSDTGVVDDLTNIYNNTLYSSTTNNQILGVSIFATPLRTTVKNNLFVATKGTQQMVNGMGVGPLVSDHNVLSSTPSSVFVSGTPTVSSDYALKSGSAAIGAGTPLPVWDDFIRAARSSPWDVGAYAH